VALFSVYKQRQHIKIQLDRHIWPTVVQLGHGCVLHRMHFGFLFREEEKYSYVYFQDHLASLLGKVLNFTMAS
jgi:hypothetical protein